MNLLCLVGIHRPIWQPIPTLPDTSWAPPVRVCRDCHRPLGRTHRD